MHYMSIVYHIFILFLCYLYTGTFSKVLERVLYDQIASCFNEYNLLTPHQSGFRSGFPTQDVTID